MASKAVAVMTAEEYLALGEDPPMTRLELSEGRLIGCSTHAAAAPHVTALTMKPSSAPPWKNRNYCPAGL